MSTSEVSATFSNHRLQLHVIFLNSQPDSHNPITSLSLSGIKVLEIIFLSWLYTLSASREIEVIDGCRVSFKSQFFLQRFFPFQDAERSAAAL
jgi:hypothetical protein